MIPAGAAAARSIRNVIIPNNMVQDTLSEIRKHIRTPKRSVLALHINPDLDSTGSSLAMYKILEQNGHTVDIYSQDPVSEAYEFMKNVDKIKIMPADAIPWSSYDYYWALDTADYSRNGKTSPYPDSLFILNIDHHISNPGWGTINHIDADAISTASILLQIAQTLDQDIAQCLMAGLAGDSGFFAFAQDEKPFRDAEKLMKAGADLQLIRYYTNQQIPMEDLQFISEAIKLIQIHEKKKAVILPIPEHIWKTYGVSANKNKYMTHYLYSIQGTDCGVMLIENSRDYTRLELRSRKPGFDVSRIAAQLGGGGHETAAGARVKRKPLQDIVEDVLRLLP